MESSGAAAMRRRTFAAMSFSFMQFIRASVAVSIANFSISSDMSTVFT